jgi:hypothetical protein
MTSAVKEWQCRWVYGFIDFSSAPQKSRSLGGGRVLRARESRVRGDGRQEVDVAVKSTEVVAESCGEVPSDPQAEGHDREGRMTSLGVILEEESQSLESPGR